MPAIAADLVVDALIASVIAVCKDNVGIKDRVLQALE
jgi:hypothetical protein